MLSDAEVILLADEKRIEEASTRLARVGLENARSFLDLESWRSSGNRVTSVPQISVIELQRMTAEEPDLQVVDVRRPGEFREAHARGAVNLPLHELSDRSADLDAERPVAVICAGGYRSSIGTSILERHGFRSVLNVTGGTAAWLAAGLPTG